MALTHSTESTGKLIDYLSYIGMMLTSSVQDGASSDSESNVEIGELFGQMLGHAEEQGMFNGRQALQHTLEEIGASLTEAGPDVDKLALMPLLDALKAYLQDDEPELQVKTIVAYLPDILSDNYAVMLFTEAGFFSGAFESGTTPTADSTVSSFAPISNAQNDNESVSPADDTDPFITFGAAVSPEDNNNRKPIQAALNLAVEEFHALLNSESSMPGKESLQALLQDHLGNLEFIAETIDANAFLHCLESLQEWATKELHSQQVELSTFLSELLVRLADLPFDKIDHTEQSADDAEVNPSHNETTAIETFTDDRLAMLYEELSEFDEQLKQQALILTTDETAGETLIECIDSYSELLGRLNSACVALGLHGLARVCDFVIENVNLLPAQQSDRLTVRPLLTRWPELVKLYLSDPADDSALMGLIDLLQDAAWPNRFDGLDSRDLYAQLSSGATEEDELTSEEPRLTQVTAEDISLELSADINLQLFEAFMIESPDVAARFNQVISTLDTSDNPFEGMRSAQRLSHTLKGSANLVGIKGIANLAHYIEDILDTLSRRHVAPSSSLITVLHEAADCLESMIDTVAGKERAPDNALEVLQQVLDIANLVDSGDYDPAADTPLSKTGHAIRPVAAQTPSSTTTPASSGAETIRVPTSTVDAMFRLVEEITISLAQVNEHINRVKQRSESLNLHDRNLQQRRFDLENLVDVRSIAAMQKRLHKTRQGVTKFDPLEMDQYDELHGATHSYIEAVADAREISSVLHDEILELDSFMLRQSRLNKELQQLVSATRMVPVSEISSRLQRAVRQASRATGNAAELIIDHQNLMMDGDVLNKLVDPLLHILRNAVDHGMSHAEAASESGQITVRFLQEGSNVVIRCKDNGKGLDYARIREVAIERGMLRPEQKPANEKLARFIMSPAFTTRSATTQVSGRGIGMDAVFTVITELKGTISVHDVEPHGTEFVIRLPLSLVTTHSLVVQSGTEVYAIPSTTLSQILSPGTGEIQQREDGYTFRLAREMFAMRFLTSLLGYDSDSTPESATILLTGRGTTPAAIAVDAVLQSTELVIKRLGRFVPKVMGVAGISVLGDGRVIPVLDLPELLLASQDETVASSSARPISVIHPLRQVVGRPTALVVDDSLSARNSLGQLLEDSGYAVLTARDGIEAVELLQTETPLVVLADLEMPRMDGIELTRYIRSNEHLQQLPVIMITSRSQKKHRQEAESAGVSAYLTKPFIDDELIDVITALV